MIYCISKQLEIAGCHHLQLSYESKCQRVHGHNWLVTVFLAASELNADGMVVDYNHIKHVIHDYLDHGDFNELLPFNPTAENIARWVVDQLPQCYKCVVVESEKNVAQAYDEQFPIDPKYLL
jgi:6-pyruvoyltetrahydropterin/6-carboxytetrahydropterin synthase